jgi:hypothetical protein
MGDAMPGSGRVQIVNETRYTVSAGKASALRRFGHLFFRFSLLFSGFGGKVLFPHFRNVGV